MPKTLSLLTGAAFIALGNFQPAKAQQSGAVKTNLEMAIEALSREVKGYRTEIESLRGQLTDVHQKLEQAEIPAGAVIAFDLRSGCPDGWNEFSEGNGKFLIGSGEGKLTNTGPYSQKKQGAITPLPSIEFGLQGGALEHKLTRLEVPNHSHLVYGNWSADHTPPESLHNLQAHKNTSPTSGYALRLPTEEIKRTQDDHLGDTVGSAHNNMPPYIALHFCRRMPPSGESE